MTQESKGYLVLTARDGAEAVAAVSQTPDVILLDVNMPEMDGLSVCRRIRDEVNCPIIFLTSRIEDTDKIAGFSAGGDDYVIKLFSLAELGARVEAHIRREHRESRTRHLAVVAEHVRRIRAKLAKFGEEKHIETVGGMGYKWVK